MLQRHSRISLVSSSPPLAWHDLFQLGVIKLLFVDFMISRASLDMIDARHAPCFLQGPQLVIIVPTRELGVQTVMIIYKLFGGAVNSQVPGDAANMFTYQGPRGLKVICCS